MFLIALFTLIENTLQIQSITDCQTTQFYNSATHLCESCPTNTTRYNATLCVCDVSKGFHRQQDSYIGFQYTSLCSQVGNNCTETQAILRYAYSGQSTGSTLCTQCADNAYPNAWKESCISCSHRNMTYKSGCVCDTDMTLTNDTCILTSSLSIQNVDLTDEFRIQFDVQVQSDFIKQKYEYAIAGCYNYKTVDACQLLIHVCVLQLYNRKFDICNIFFDTTMQSNVNVPLLFYFNTTQQITEDTSYTQALTLDSISSQRYLPYYLGVFSIDGTFIGYKTLESELILCPHQPDDAKNAKAFGLNVEISCTLNMQPYTQDYTMYFYELYLKTGDSSYARVPILVTNYQDENGNYANLNAQTQFVTRFFTVDTLSTKADYKNIFNQPSYMRYPKSIKFVVTPQHSDIQHIYIPYVRIEYAYVQSSAGQFGNVDLSFRVQHSSDSSNYWTTIIVLFSVFTVILIIMALVRIYIWRKSNPQESIGKNYYWQLLFNSIYLVLDTWNDGMFYFLFFNTMYWFVFFKFQTAPFIMMLNQDDYAKNYDPFITLFYFTFAIRIIITIYFVIKQSQINLFFIDWEKTEFELPKVQSEAEKLASTIKSKQSVWRTLLVGNEFSELQTIRIVSVEWTLVIFGFIMMGLKLDERFTESPDLIETQNFIPNNPILMYFLIQFVYLIIGIAQLLLKLFLNIWIPYPYEDFVDLCSIANISLFILDKNLHGYYIHGENPFGFSEGSLQHLQECFRNETKERGKNRGLVKEGYDSQLCTFELYVPPKFRQQFDSAYSTLKNYKEKSELKSLGVEYVEVQRFQIDQFLKNKIKEVRRVDNRNNFIRTKENAQRFFDYPPDELSRNDFNQMNLPYFFRDPQFSYKNILFCGNEMFLLITDIMILTFWMFITNNIAGSMLLQYFCTKCFAYMKMEMQKSNISEKTRIDKRFLI